jgi:molybdate transport system ATP-binding protein
MHCLSFAGPCGKSSNMSNLTEKQQGQMAQNTTWLELKEVVTQTLRIGHFTAAGKESWCVLGNVGSGIDTFVQLLSGNVEVESADLFVMPENCAVVSFRGQQELYEQEVRNDDSDFMDRLDPGTLARDFIGPSGNTDELIKLFRLEHVMNSGFRQLSSGESRKLLLLEAITHGAATIVVEKPYDGLDVQSCSDFDRTMVRLMDQGISIVIVLTSRSDLPPWCTHLAVIEAQKILVQGEVHAVLDQVQEKDSGESWSDSINGFVNVRESKAPAELVRLVNGQARYGGRSIFSGLDLLVSQDEHTLITGPNGAGKSTLLALITGDHSDCYTNELYLFGTRRGSGESIWQLKKEMGIVSPALHREHYVPGNALQIVISGFYDSIGLYQKYSGDQKDRARSWLSRIGLADFEKTPFRRLSYAQQRLTLIARALIKMPRLLILDEPTQGLDDSNRSHLLDFLEMVADKEISTILYVSHRRDEYRDFFRQRIELESLA